MAKKELTVGLGIDIGNAFTKTSTGIKFLSKVSNDYGKGYSNNCYDVAWNDSKYLVGDIDGVSFTNSNKYDTEEYLVTLLTSIALSYIDEESDVINAYIGLGIPVEEYEYLKEKCKKTALQLNTQQITVNGVTKTINIEDVIVVPQSAIIADKDIEDLPALIFDFGGGTLDVSVWDINANGKIYKTYGKSYNEFGFDHVVDNFITMLRATRNMNIDYFNALTLLDNPIIKSKVRAEIDITEERDGLLINYLTKVKKILDKDNLPSYINSVYLCGGCGKILKDKLEDVFGYNKGSVQADKEPQLSNAMVYELFAKELINEEE